MQCCRIQQPQCGAPVLFVSQHVVLQGILGPAFISAHKLCIRMEAQYNSDNRVQACDQKDNTD